MYITDTTNYVRKFIEELEKLKDVNKLRFLIYIFGLLNNNQINDKNDASPDLVDDDNIEIFTFTSLGFSENACTMFLQNLVTFYNILTSSKEAYEENGNVLGIKFDETDKKFASKFEKMGFIEKLDVFSEIIIRYDNETYFDEKITMLNFDSKMNGFDIANLIQKIKL